MDFISAVKEMRKGRKVMLGQDELIIHMGTYAKLQNYEGEKPRIVQLFTKDIDSNLWEVVEENKPLADKMESHPFLGQSFKASDVKEALKELFNWIETEKKGCPNCLSEVHCKSPIHIKEKAKEIFGERLL